MKLKSFFSICASAALLAAGTVHLRAQSLEPFNPYGIFSPSVEAWQMTRYGNLTPSLYTGAMTFSLPLYTYEDPDFTIPISLEYSFDGYRPAQHSGTVGYGWYLNCGGVITREVRGIPDEGIDDFDYECRIHGWHEMPNYSYRTDLASAPVYSSRRLNGDTIPVDRCYALLTGYDPFSDVPMYSTAPSPGTDYDLYDPASDIYHFIFPGHSGNFVIMPDGTVSVYGSDLPYGEVSVDIVWGSNSFAPEITIRTGDGYRYRFTDGSSSSSFGNSLDDNHRLGTTVTSLVLDRITAPNGRYVEFDYVLTHATDAAMTYPPMKKGWTYFMSEAYGDQGEILYDVPDPRESYTEETCRCLSGLVIHETDESTCYRNVSFEYTPAPGNEYAMGCFGNTEDIATHLCGRQSVISAMKVRNAGNEIVEEASMSYAAAPHGTPKTFLTSVTTLRDGKYSFRYDLDRFSLPQNDTQGTDHWGFWNGRTIDNLTNHLVAKDWHNPGHLYDQVTDGVKEADWQYSRCGALTQITYPTGGVTSVSYEANVARRRLNSHFGSGLVTIEPADSTATSAVWEVGGVRVASITYSDNTGHDFCESFKYEDAQSLGSGILMQMPLYAMVVSYQHTATDIQMSYSNYNSSITAIGFNNVCNFRLAGDPHIVYTQVKAIHPDGSFTRLKFTSVDDGYVDLHQQTSIFNVKRTACTNDYIGPEYGSLAGMPTCLPPSTIDLSSMRGKLLQKADYSADGTIVHRVDNDYLVHGTNLGLAYSNDLLTYRGWTQAVNDPFMRSTVEMLHGITTTITYTYNTLGQVVSEERIAGTGSVADTIRTSFGYLHEMVDTTSLTAALNAASCVRIADGAQHLVAAEEYSYGAWPTLGNPKPTAILRHAPDGSVRTTVVSYDARFRPNSLAFPGGSYITYTWDGNNLQTRTDNGASNTTSFVWKDLVGPTLITAPSGEKTGYMYDSHSRLQAVSDGLGNTVTEYNYKLTDE